MKIFHSLPVRNLLRRPARTMSLVLLAAFLSLSVFGGSVMVKSLQRGLGSLEARLGADIMVVPYEAAAKSDLENIVLQGNTGYFYMDQKYYDQIAAIDGIDEISAQFFLASCSAGCCSVAVQIVGIDPDTDFTVEPWIKKSYGKELKHLDIVVGNDLSVSVGDTMTLYGIKCHVAGKLDKTGTMMDTAVYTNKDTIQTLIQASIDRGLNTFSNIHADKVVSSVLINVKDGYSVDDVLDDINLHVRKVKAVKTKNMISGISDSLNGVSNVTTILIAVVWLFSLVILFIAFHMMINERKKEFAVLRVVGASKKKVSMVVLEEAAAVSLAGGLLGVVLGIASIFLFSGLLEEMIGLPFLLPSIRQVCVLAVGSLAAAVLAGAISSVVKALQIGNTEPGLILREGN